MYITFMLVRAPTLRYYSLIMIQHLHLISVEYFSTSAFSTNQNNCFGGVCFQFSPVTFKVTPSLGTAARPAASAYWPIFLWLHVCYITAFILHLMCYESPYAYVTMWALMIALCQLLLTAADLSQWHFLDAQHLRLFFRSCLTPVVLQTRYWKN